MFVCRYQTPSGVPGVTTGQLFMQQVSERELEREVKSAAPLTTQLDASVVSIKKAPPRVQTPSSHCIYTSPTVLQYDFPYSIMAMWGGIIFLLGAWIALGEQMV